LEGWIKVFLTNFQDSGQDFSTIFVLWIRKRVQDPIAGCERALCLRCGWAV